MKPMKITVPSKGGAASADTGFVDVETSDGPYQIQFSADDAARIALCFELAGGEVFKERERLGLTPIQKTLVKKIAGLEFGSDHLRQVALIRTRFVDQSTQDTALARDQIQPAIEALQQILKRFEDQSSVPLQ